MARAPEHGDGAPVAGRSRIDEAPRTAVDPLVRLLVVGEDVATAGVVAALHAGSANAVEVHRAAGLAAALDRLEGRGLDAVVLALASPQAFEALRALRAADPTVAIVGAAVEDDPVSHRRAFLEGAEDVVVAPWSGVELARSLRHAVERHRIHAALRLQAEQHETIVEGSIQGIVIHQDGVVRYANAALARLLGYDSPAAIIGANLYATPHISPAERDRLLAIGRARGRGEAVPAQYVLEARRRDGAIVQVECLVTVIEWEGQPAKLATMIDVTDRKRTEEAMGALAEIGRELVGAVDLGAAARTIVSRVRDVFGARLAALYRLEAGGDTLVCAAAAGLRAHTDWVGRSLRVGEGIAGKAVAEREPVWTLDVLADPRIVARDAIRAFVREEGFGGGVAVPLIVSDQAVGALFLGDPREYAFTREGIDLLASFADRAALAVERTALYQRAAGRAEKLEVLARVSGLIASATDSGRVLEAISRAAISLLGATAAGVLVDDPAANLLRVGEHYRADSPDPWMPRGATDLPYGQGIAGVVYKTRAPAFVEDINDDPRWMNRGLLDEGPFHAFAGLPLIARDRVVGVLSILFGDRRGFSAEERELMTLLADQAAIAMDNARLLQETERRRSTAEALADVGRLLAQSLDLTVVASRITETVRDLLAVTNAALFRFRPDLEDLESLSLEGDHGTARGQTIVYGLGQGAVGVAARERRAVVTSDLLEDASIPQPPSQRARMERASFRAVLAVPLMVRGRLVGALALGDRVGRQFTAEEVQVVEAFATRAAIALEAARLYEEIRDARDFLQSIAESSADAIITTDVRHHVSYWSRGAEEVFGYAAREVLGRPVAELYAGGAANARLLMTRLHRDGRVRDWETTVRAKDGREIAASGSFSLLRRADGVVAGTLGVVKDVTERKTLEESLRQAQKMEAVGRLAGGIAHDFNNLITVIIARSQMLLERLRPEDPLRRDLELFEKTGERAAALTRQLLAFSRRQVLQPKLLDLNGVVSNMDSMLKRLIGEDVELRAIPGRPLSLVKADPGQLEQVIVNLAVNARDAMPNGGRLTLETANVELDTDYARVHSDVPPGHYVMLAVSDTGCGMDADTQARIFEPFFTTKGPGKGTGLGLSTVYGIVKQSDGHIWVYSEPGHGTTFKIYLPRAGEMGRTEEAAVARDPQHPEGGRETILLVEDEPDLREVVREALETFGYNLLEAGHGAEGLQIAEGHAGPIHLLLTDVIMPAMNGAELARRLRDIRPEVDVVFISGYTDDAITQHGVLEPGVAFLQKPFSPTQLVRRVREVLNARRA